MASGGNFPFATKIAKLEVASDYNIPLKEPPLIKFIVVIHLPPKVTLALPRCFLILTSHSRHTPFGRAVTALMRVSKNWKDFHAMLNHAFRKRSSQDLLFS